ncbi:hypothetical protein [Francisella frigiditurris]|uniref:Uncharacterized protein n=1 Tax=Francisella frigiditurris TaxID=1542390 RepID=A0A1J0KU87_9GAMM|nr:hypothetical protein [Francisella frigiditurris]APC97251.1 hypothetical protein KX01_230 [Francisella frigiditurris]
MKKKRKQKGVALIEALISTIIIMLVSFYAFSLISNYRMNAVMQNTQTELLRELDDRVIMFDTLGTFNENDFNGNHGLIIFCYNISDGPSSTTKTYTFTATNRDLNISKDLVAISDVILGESTHTQTNQNGGNVCS